MLKLHRAYLAATDQLMTMAAGGMRAGLGCLTSPEAAVHNFFAATTTISIRSRRPPRRSGSGRRVAPTMSMPSSRPRSRPAGPARAAGARGRHARHAARIRRGRREVLLSEALDHPNRVFPAGPCRGLIENRALFDEILSEAGQHRRPRARALPGGTGQLLRRRRADALRPLPGRGAGLEIRFRPPRHALRRQLRTGLPPRHDAAAQGRAGGAVLLSADRQGRQRHQAVQRHRLSTSPNMAAPARGSTCTPRSGRRAGSCRNSSRCRTPASSSSSPAPSTAPASPGTRRTCAWPWPWAARWSISTGSAMPRTFAASRAHPTPIGINCRICPRANCDQRAHNAMVPDRTAGRTPPRHHALRQLRQVSTRNATSR
jgi:hypothetical protein